MCGRYTLTASPAALAEHFELESVPELAPRFNVAPTQSVPVVRLAGGRRRLEPMRWGLVPHWAGDPSIGARLINARRETVASKPAFRDAFRHHRCLVPADGFYEWRSGPGRGRSGRQPHHLSLPGRRLFAFAGLHARWLGAGEGAPPLDTCTLLTMAANERVAPLHDRMPVILDPAAYAAWLDPDAEPEALEALLDAGPMHELGLQRVGPRVNDTRHDDPRCLQDEPPPQAELF